MLPQQMLITIKIQLKTTNPRGKQMKPSNFMKVLLIFDRCYRFVFLYT